MHDISGASHWNNTADVVIVHRDFEENITRVITNKEQGLHGEIGSVFKYVYQPLL